MQKVYYNYEEHVQIYILILALLLHAELQNVIQLRWVKGIHNTLCNDAPNLDGALCE